MPEKKSTFGCNGWTIIVTVIIRSLVCKFCILVFAIRLHSRIRLLTLPGLLSLSGATFAWQAQHFDSLEDRGARLVAGDYKL